MTIPIKRLIDTVGRSQARELLGVASDADPDECRRAALAQIDQIDYTPTASWHDSVEILFSPESEQNASTRTSKSALREEAEGGLSGQIEVYAASFFAFEPCERTRIWNGFRKRSKFSSMLSCRLAMLEPGLSLLAPAYEAFGQDRQSQLIRWIITIFPLRMPDRASNWNLARDAMRDSPRDWETAAEQLNRDNPEIARLVLELVTEARTLTVQQRSRERQMKARQRAVKRSKWARWRSVLSPNGGISRSVIVVAVFFGGRFIVNSLSHVDFSNKPALPGQSEYVRDMWRQAMESAKAKHAAEQEAALAQLADRVQFFGLEMALIAWDAAESMPLAERFDARNRMLAGQRLTAEQVEILERHFEELHQQDALRQIREFQEMARPERESFPGSIVELMHPDVDPSDSVQEKSQPSEPESTVQPDGSGS